MGRAPNLGAQSICFGATMTMDDAIRLLRGITGAIAVTDCRGRNNNTRRTGRTKRILMIAHQRVAIFRVGIAGP